MLLDVGDLTAQIVSDLHIDAWRSVNRAPQIEREGGADVLLIAGDLCNGLPSEADRAWLRSIASQGDWPDGILMVLGNHDYYGRGLRDAPGLWQREVSGSGIRLLDRDSTCIKGVRIAGCTLWTDFDRGDPLAMLRAQLQLSDYIAIRSEQGFVTAPDLLDAHRKDLAWLHEQKPGTPDDPLIVVTHHAPSNRSIAPRFRGDALNPAFTSNLDWLAQDLHPVAWIHGHVHTRHDYTIGATRVLCNPLGYPGEAVE